MARIYLSPPDVGAVERQLVLDAFDSNWVAPLGPHVDAFEAEVAAVAGVPHAAALSSGTAALHLALRLLGVGPDDDVLVSTLSFISPAGAVAYLGARPVFVDSDPTTWNMDPDLLAGELAARAAAGRLPRAVVVVDLYGQCADFDPIHEACAPFEVPVIEDAAEALGASYRGRPAGSLGAMGVFSFNGNKIITTSAGGMLVGRSRAWIDRARHLANQAREVAAHYEHLEVGFNYRMSNLLAAVGRGQLRTLPERLHRRRQINAFYRQTLGCAPGIELMPRAAYGEPNHWLTCITIDPDQFGATAEDVRLQLESVDIESRPTWKPLHRQPAFAGAPVVNRGVAERVFEQGLCLPSGSALGDGELERVVESVLTTPRTRRPTARAASLHGS